jgi:hypothetical protein
MVAICTTSFTSQTFYGLATECIYVFCEAIRTNSALGDWLFVQWREREFTVPSEMSV